jgi:hypothetical protein
MSEAGQIFSFRPLNKRRHLSAEAGVAFISYARQERPFAGGAEVSAITTCSAKTFDVLSFLKQDQPNGFQSPIDRL